MGIRYFFLCLFFRLASNAFPDIGSVTRKKKNITRSLGIGGPDVGEQSAQYVKGLNPGVISIVNCRVSSSG